MSKDSSFQVERKFWDDEHFPYGFARSGDFTLEQAMLMETYGLAYIALARGERTPKSKQEKDFVAFCQGKKAAENAHEKTWRCYSEKINRPIKRYSLAATASRQVPIDECEMDVD